MVKNTNLKKLGFVSNLKASDIGGGWSGINHYLYSHISNNISTAFIGPINPKSSVILKVLSRINRELTGSGSYFFFSEERLDRISKEFKELVVPCKAFFFFGATPWINIDLNEPYYVYLDICFLRYLDIFLKNKKYNKRDIERIGSKENRFLQNAKHIFWGSNWALNEARELYKSKFKNSTVISTGGNIVRNYHIENGVTKKRLLFISLEFIDKGGTIAFEAFQAIKDQFPNLVFTVMGERPPDYVLNYPNVEYVGRLYKSDPKDLKRFIQILLESYFLIHPTVKDTMGAVIAEAGYYGVPTIAPNNFGIPDLIINNQTGFLIDLPLEANAFASKLTKALDDRKEYEKMSNAVFEFMNSQRSWESIGNKIQEIINDYQQ